MSMGWGFAFRLRQRYKGSLWVVPALGVLAGVLLGALSILIDDTLAAEPVFIYSASTASAVLSANIGAMTALTGFVVTVAVLAVQLATSSFSARYMRLWYRDGMLKGLIAFLLGTLAFSYVAIRNVEEDSVPNLTVTLAAVAVLASLLLFVLFFDRFLHRLRPVAVAAYVAEEGRRAFEGWVSVIGGPSPSLGPLGTDRPSEPSVLDLRTRSSGSIQAIDVRGLADFARRHRCLIILRHAVGDFVTREAVLLSVHGPALPVLGAERLASMVALGTERTVEQDPLFALRIMVDIANKALSPAINDPTTAVQVLDHLGETLRMIGTARLPAPSMDRPATAPGVGVRMPMPRWEEFLELGVTEIREFGASSLQVMRRLRALLEQLQELVPPERQAAVSDQLRRLDATVERTFGATEDRDIALVADHQGLGAPIRVPGTSDASDGG